MVSGWGGVSSGLNPIIDASHCVPRQQYISNRALFKSSRLISGETARVDLALTGHTVPVKSDRVCVCLWRMRRAHACVCVRVSARKKRESSDGGRKEVCALASEWEEVTRAHVAEREACAIYCHEVGCRKTCGSLRVLDVRGVRAEHLSTATFCSPAPAALGTASSSSPNAGPDLHL